MGVKTYWINDEKTILCAEFAQPWTWDDFQVNSQTMQKEAESVDHSIVTIFDLTEAGIIPASAVSNFRIAANRRTSNVKRLIFAGGSTFTRTLVEITDKTTRQAAKMDMLPAFVNSREEAITLAQQIIKSN